MKLNKLIAIMAAAASALALASAADPTSPAASSAPKQPDSARLIGWVSDGHCTTKHMKEGGEACVRKCIAGATHVNPEWAPAGMVFITEDKKVWKVDNADALWGYESKRVEIEGILNTDKGSVRVSKLIAPRPSN